MKKYIFYFILLCASGACMDDYRIDTGLANGVHDCSMWEYMKNDPGNWDSLVIAVEHAGLVGLFDGSDPDYPEITFFGPVNYSVMRYLLNSGGQYNSVREIPAERCRALILSHVVAGKRMKGSFDYEVKGTLEGGTLVENLTGTVLRVYRIQTPYLGVPDIGAERLQVHALTGGFITGVASADIQCTNGVVHALSNTYRWTEW